MIFKRFFVFLVAVVVLSSTALFSSSTDYDMKIMAQYASGYGAEALGSLPSVGM